MSQHQPFARTPNIFYVQYVSTSYLALKLFFSFNVCQILTTNLVQHTLIINHEFKFSEHLETSLTHRIISSFSYHSFYLDKFSQISLYTPTNDFLLQETKAQCHNEKMDQLYLEAMKAKDILI